MRAGRVAVRATDARATRVDGIRARRGCATRRPTRASTRLARVDLTRATSEPGDGLRDALNEARAAPAGVSEEDFANFYKVLNCQTPEEATALVRTMCERGELTEGVVEAALATMRAAEEKNEDEEVLQALRGVFNFLLDAFQQANAPAELTVIDNVVAWLNAMESGADDENAENAVLVKCVSEAGMEVGSFSASVDGFLVAMEEQDEQFTQQVSALRAKGVSQEQEEQIEQLTYMRASAKAQMLCIRDICARVTSA